MQRIRDRREYGRNRTSSDMGEKKRKEEEKRREKWGKSRREEVGIKSWRECGE